MHLFLLRPVQTLPPYNPWNPWYDKKFGFVVRAETESQARQLASDQAGEENYEGFHEPWKDPSCSTCIELLPEGDPGVIIHDQHSA